MEKFGFPPSLINSVKVIYSGFFLRVQNNGVFTDSFVKGQGVHQGCPIAPFLFIIVVELLAITLRESPELKGIKIGNELEIFLSLFADDLSSILDMSDPQALQVFFDILDRFAVATGLRINYEKTTIYRLGSLQKTKAAYFTNLKLHWTNDSFHFLGVNLAVSQEELFSHNFPALLIKTQRICGAWKDRGLTILGKVCVINALIASLFVYKLSVLPDLPDFLSRNTIKLYLTFYGMVRKPK